MDGWCKILPLLPCISTARYILQLQWSQDTQQSEDLWMAYNNEWISLNSVNSENSDKIHYLVFWPILPFQILISFEALWILHNRTEHKSKNTDLNAKKSVLFTELKYGMKRRKYRTPCLLPPPSGHIYNCSKCHPTKLFQSTHPFR